ncbi:nicotinate phosphoribosyltransferase, putative family protein [Trichomonas vaginalis G3]|uniref:Nicotinate phosphoribosyltransferase n=1 Tax=Trichomonas vaginalis (strain ATCC PRA-98 / G3) TaxID=412133 RepID=A2DLU0_TRIV3|nr:nicotinate phosphoribosyltransferase family protein [Trichomonas vaginalis G3]EAY18543.1 nicotinate phosphoribosyltransferase, putative family protein [Trichomonas vaginalis G3]KAI5491566.1 nicotinate phosphoribosyltransferase family [Trichomonas vaginalis G3]|eukprot:XP_001579529.1 nicotinate phosphoribosyltransferase family protein [Trichomonas vaginalis G3]
MQPADSGVPYTCAMLTDFYEVTICLAQWLKGRADKIVTFDLFYRTQPFKGSFAIFGGLEEAIDFIKSFRFTEDQLKYIQNNLPGVNPAFIDWLRKLDPNMLVIHAPKEGTVVFPREPLLRITGPMGLCQLIETPLLNRINFATLMTTNAARIRLLAKDRKLMEFGLRRAQGPDGAMSATRYSYLGGFDSTSNVLAGYKYGIPIAGTVAHSFISSYYDVNDPISHLMKHAVTGEDVDLLVHAEKCINENGWHTNQTELIAFIAQAQAFPTNFLALVDTYDTMTSGVPNFLAVSYALTRAGYNGKGIRLDSGDLAELSKQTRKMFKEFAEKYNIPEAAHYIITASNDINEKALLELERVGHEIDVYGIGTHLVTCQMQPALGGVYKLVEIDGHPRVKLSNDLIKVTLPGKKNLFRLYDIEGKAICDLLTLGDDEVIEPGKYTFFECWPNAQPFECTFSKAERLFHPAFEHGIVSVDDLNKARERVREQIHGGFRPDVIKIIDPAQYKVCLSPSLHQKLLQLIEEAKE